MPRIKVSQMGPKEKAARAVASKRNAAKPAQNEKKTESTAARKRLKIPKGSKMDASHKGGKIVKESRAANRSRGGKAGNRARKAAGGRKSSRKGVPNVKR